MLEVELYAADVEIGDVHEFIEQRAVFELAAHFIHVQHHHARGIEQ